MKGLNACFLRNVFVIFVMAVFAFLSTSCGGGGGGGGNPTPEETPVAQILTPNKDMTVHEGDTVFFSAYTAPQKDWTYDWNYGGGATATKGHTPGNVTFITAGVYTITLTVTAGDGSAKDSVKITVLQSSVDTDPVATIASPAGNVGLLPGGSVNFQGSVSGGNAPFQYRWNFGGAAAESTAKDPGNITFNTAGTFTVSFTVTDQDGDTSTDTVVITVSQQDTVPTATIVNPAADAVIFTNGSLVFDGESSGGNYPISYSWSFGAGMPSSTLLDPGRVTFPNNGTFNVTLTATDADGDHSSDSMRVTVVNGTPSLSSPANSAAIINPDILLQWNSVTYAGSYGVQVSRNSQFTNLVTDISTSANSHQVTGLASGTYYWRVNATDGNGNDSSWSSVRTFTVTIATVWYRSSAGYDHTLAIRDSDKSLWAWGENVYGQLGDGTDAPSDVPVMITPEIGWEFVCAGYYTSFAIKSDGTLWAWGRNNNFQLGDGTSTNRNSPVLIGLSDDEWLYVSNRGDHTAALKSDGSLFMWGTGGNGQLGTGVASAQIAVPTQLGEDVWLQVEAGRYHTAGIKSNGSLWTWGSNSNGQLGDGTLVDRHILTRIGAAGDIWTQVSTGWYFTLAIKGGELYGAGSNFYGQIAPSPYTYRENIVQIGSDDDWYMVAAGYDHFMGVKQDNTLWGAGCNDSGQLLGSFTLATRYSLSQFSTETVWESVNTGRKHTMALRVNGTMYGSGLNDSGQVGVGSLAERITEPTLVNAQ